MEGVRHGCFVQIDIEVLAFSAYRFVDHTTLADAPHVARNEVECDMQSALGVDGCASRGVNSP